MAGRLKRTAWRTRLAGLVLLGVLVVGVGSLVALEDTGGSAAAKSDGHGGPFTPPDPPPSLVSISRADASPSRSGPLHWTVTFSESVRNVGTGNFGLVTANLGGAAPSVSSVSPNGGVHSSWTVTVSTAGTTGSNNGSVGLKLTSAGSIEDNNGNGLTGSLPAGQLYVFDTTAPLVAVTRVNGAAVSFPFVSGANVTSIGGTCGSVAASVTVSGDLAPVAWSIGSQHGTASCSGGNWASSSFSLSSSGTYTASASQADQAGNTGSGGGQVKIDRSVPNVLTIDRAGVNPTNGASVAWTVVFSKSVTGVGSGNFSLQQSGLSGSPAVTGVTGGGASYTVSASTGGVPPSGTGTLQLRLSSAGTIQDSSGNGLTGVPFSGQTYTIDKTPPTAPVFTAKPSSPDDSTGTTFRFQSTGLGGDGDDDDDDGGYLCSLDGAPFRVCSARTSLDHLTQGTHTFRVEAFDDAGNLSGMSSWTWVVDTVDPTVHFTQTPPNPSSTATSTFDWTGSDPPPGSGIAYYRCSKENGKFVPCPNGTPPYTFAVSTTNNGQHQFAVEAVDFAGNVSSPAKYKWKVVKSSGQDYTISGDVSVPLGPGAPAQPINVAFSNPNVGNGGSGANGVQVSSLTVTIQSVTAPNATPSLPCTVADFAVTQYGGSYPFYVPQGASSLSTIFPSLPTNQYPSIRMIDRHDTVPGDGTGNQDGCKGAMIHLTYTGTP